MKERPSALNAAPAYRGFGRTGRIAHIKRTTRARRVATPLEPRVHEAEHDGHEQQRRQRAEREPADHRAAERRVLLAAVAEAERHRQHPDQHRERGHHDRTEAAEAGVERGLPRRCAAGEQLARRIDDEDAVRGRDADAQDRPGQRRHRQRRARHEQHPRDAGQRRRQAADDHERIEPRLEIDDHQQVDQRDRERETAEQPGERLVHRLHLAAQHDRRAGRQLRARVVDELRHVGRDRAEVAPLHRRENVEHRLHVVVRHDRLLRRAREAAERAEQVLRGRTGRRAAGRGDGASLVGNGTFASACSESIVYCGVCTSTG
jgi:hypothetical protein